MDKLSTKELEIEANKAQVEKNIDKKYELQTDMNTQDINFENYEKRQKQIKTEIATNISELDATRLTKDEIAKGFYEIDSKRNKVVANLEEINKKREESDKK